MQLEEQKSDETTGDSQGGGNQSGTKRCHIRWKHGFVIEIVKTKEAGTRSLKTGTKSRKTGTMGSKETMEQSSENEANRSDKTFQMFREQQKDQEHSGEIEDKETRRSTSELRLWGRIWNMSAHRLTS